MSDICEECKTIIHHQWIIDPKGFGDWGSDCSNFCRTQQKQKDNKND